jgi:hypothetical protein
MLIFVDGRSHFSLEFTAMSEEGFLLSRMDVRTLHCLYELSRLSLRSGTSRELLSTVRVISNRLCGEVLHAGKSHLAQL